jgi:hypothetical protein
MNLNSTAASCSSGTALQFEVVILASDRSEDHEIHTWTVEKKWATIWYATMNRNWYRTNQGLCVQWPNPDEESLGSTTFHSISNECSYIQTWKQREMCLKVELIWDRLLNVVLLTVPPTPTVRLWSLQLPRPMDLKDESDNPQPINTSSNWKLCPSHWSSKLFVAIWVQPLVLRTFNLEFFAMMCVTALPDTC